MRAYVVAAFVFALLNTGAPAFAAPAVDQSADAGKSDAVADVPTDVEGIITGVAGVVAAVPAAVTSGIGKLVADAAGSLPTTTPSLPAPLVRRDDILGIPTGVTTAAPATPTVTTTETITETLSSSATEAESPPTVTEAFIPIKRQDTTGPLANVTVTPGTGANVLSGNTINAQP